MRGPGGGLREVSDLDKAVTSAFNEGIPAPLSTSPSSGLVFARRKRSAFKGPMVHTANLMLSGGISSPGVPNGTLRTEDDSSAVGRLEPRKSIIVEDDMEDEDVEEVDAFSGPEDHHSPTLAENQISQGGGGLGAGNMENTYDADDADESSPTLSSPRPSLKRTLAPSPDIGSIPIRPLRSSSLQSSSLPSPQFHRGSGVVHPQETKTETAGSRA